MLCRLCASGSPIVTRPASVLSPCFGWSRCGRGLGPRLPRMIRQRPQKPNQNDRAEHHDDNRQLYVHGSSFPGSACHCGGRGKPSCSSGEIGRSSGGSGGSVDCAVVPESWDFALLEDFPPPETFFGSPSHASPADSRARAAPARPLRAGALPLPTPYSPPAPSNCFSRRSSLRCQRLPPRSRLPESR
jgi:hypothetical protein